MKPTRIQPLQSGSVWSIKETTDYNKKESKVLLKGTLVVPLFGTANIWKDTVSERGKKSRFITISASCLCKCNHVGVLMACHRVRQVVRVRSGSPVIRPFKNP